MIRVIEKWLIVSIISTIIVFGLTGIALAVEFSADIKQGMPGPNATTTYVKGKICIKGHSERKEYYNFNWPILIFLPDMGVELQLFADTKQYGEISRVIPFRERSVSLNSTRNVLRYLQKLPAFKKVGKTKIAGFMCYKNTFIDSKNEISGIVYVSPKLGCLLKMSVNTIGGKETLELSNIMQCKQPNSLFCIPKGYHKLPPHPGPGM